MADSPVVTDTKKYYMCGAISGMVGILISHPVDTIKTHLQTNNTNTLKTFQKTLPSLYRGVKSPLIGVGFEKAIVFGTYKYCKNKSLSTPLAGALAGLTASFIVSPYEQLKIISQTSTKVKIKPILELYRGNSGYNAEYKIGRLFLKGLMATFTREVPGFAIYFTVYENIKSYINKAYDRNINLGESFIAGGVSGITAWMFIYPQDRIKTILQSNTTTITGGPKINYFTVARNIYNTGGLLNFYRGFSWAIARALLLHGGTFCTMEYLISNIDNISFNFSL
jgi:solute carrier family 25 carnitine/acylcarnitine transporter 20/29